MKIVGAAFRLDAYDCAGSKAVVGIIVVGDHTALLRSFGVRKRRGEQQVVVHVGYAIQQVIRAALASTVGGAASLAWKREAGLQCAVGVQNIGHAGSEEDQAGGIAAIEWQLRNGILIYDCAEFG